MCPLPRALPEQVTNGKGAMPAWGDRLDEEEIVAVSPLLVLCKRCTKREMFCVRGVERCYTRGAAGGTFS